MKPAENRAAKLQQATREHYSHHPLEFMTEADEADIEKTQPPPFVQFSRKYLRAGGLVADVGCGPGRAALYLSGLGVRVVAIDLSLPSLLLARQRAPGCAFGCATNLQLPFGPDVFDAVVSDGVAHHTPDARKAFVENLRILKPGGCLYFAVYKRWRYYYYLYRYLGAPLRLAARWSCGRTLIHATLLPAYYLVHLAKSRGKRTWAGAKSFFYDYFLTPRATFHSKREVLEWAAAAGCDVAHYDRVSLGNCHVFVVIKRPSA
jgi:SAM-dependent methyltransferase